MKICGVYKITNLINNKVYIGQSLDIKKRWREEKNIKRLNAHLKASFIKYGLDNFKFEILEECPPLIKSERECFYIKKYQSNNRLFGYNKTTGGEESFTFLDEVKEKISKSVKATMARPEIKIKCTGNRTKRTLAWKKHLSEYNKGRIPPKHVMDRLKNPALTTRKKISEKVQAYWDSETGMARRTKTRGLAHA